MLWSPPGNLIYDLLAPPLILATAFVSFINHNGYSYGAAEIWISLAALTTVGLLCGAVMALGRWSRIFIMAGVVTIFVDLQFDVLNEQPTLRVPAFGVAMLLLCWLMRDHLSRMAVVVFATMLAATLALPGASGEASFDRQALHQDARHRSKPAPPVLVHLILDQFIGLEGIPWDRPDGAAVRERLQALFLANGFHVFGRAYSRFENTRNAIPGVLNYASIPYNAKFIAGNAPKRLVENKYFQDMLNQGYNIHVYQTDFMDFCTGFEEQVASCRTYMITGIQPVEHLKSSAYIKSQLIMQTFVRLSVIQIALSSYYDALRWEALSRGYDLPPWVFSNFTLAPARAIHDLNSIAAAAAGASAGEMFFAHLLIPHTPFMYERNCKVRDPDGWDDDNDRFPLPPNTAESRARRYTLYFEQVLCVESKLQEIFAAWREAGVYDLMKIIIHGDHGSRIVLNKPTGSNKHRMLISDYTDSFSTLFAVKAPGQEATYDTRMVAIQDLLMPVAQGLPLDQLPARDTEPYVLLENGDDMVRQPMPQFGGLR